MDEECDQQIDYDAENKEIVRISRKSPDHQAAMSAVMSGSESIRSMRRLLIGTFCVSTSIALLLRERVPTLAMLGEIGMFLSGGTFVFSAFAERLAFDHIEKLSHSHALRVRMILQTIRDGAPSLRQNVDAIEAQIFPKES